jgi:exoribonuclease R
VPEGQAGRPVDKQLWTPLTKDLKMLTVFSRFLKNLRGDNGSLDLNQGAGGELKFKLDDKGVPVSVQGKQELEIHSTIAELMIIANSTVAKLIFDTTPREALVRIHGPATESKMKELMELSKITGINLFKNESYSELKKTLQTFKDDISNQMKKQGKNQEEISTITELHTSYIIKIMNEAKYCSAGSLTGELFQSNKDKDKDIKDCGFNDISETENHLGHYGLGLSSYTHFTSPIRRYADIIVWK